MGNRENYARVIYCQNRLPIKIQFFLVTAVREINRNDDRIRIM